MFRSPSSHENEITRQRSGASLYFPGPNGLPGAGPRPRAEVLPGARVMVARARLEDRVAVRESLMRMGMPGDRISMADSVATAMFVYHVFRPNVVIVDVDMPSVDGKTLAAALLAIDPSLRFVAITGAEQIHPKVQSLMFNRAFTVLRSRAGEKDLRIALQQAAPSQRAAAVPANVTSTIAESVTA